MTDSSDTNWLAGAPFRSLEFGLDPHSDILLSGYEGPTIFFAFDRQREAST